MSGQRRPRHQRPKPGRYRLTRRDFEILRSVGRMGQVNTGQIQRCFFATRSTASRRLAKLAALGLLDIATTHPDEPNIYTRSGRGLARLTTAGVGAESLHRVRVGRNIDVHLQLLNDLRIEFVLAARRRSDVELRAFHGDLDLRRQAGAAPPAYIPDAIAELGLPHVPGGALALMLEVDTGTEGVAAFAGKVEVTVELWRTGRRCWGAEPKAWRPVAVVLDAKRARNLARAIVSAGGGDLWLVAELPHITKLGAFAAVFAVARDVADVAPGAAIPYTASLVADTGKEES